MFQGGGILLITDGYYMGTIHRVNLEYCKIPLVSPGLLVALKAFWWAYFQEGLIWVGFIIGGKFAF